MQRISWVFWYYFLLGVIVSVLFLFADLSEFIFLRRLVGGMFVFLLLNPFLFLFRRELNRREQHFAAKDQVSELSKEVESLKRIMKQSDLGLVTARKELEGKDREIQAREVQLRLARERLQLLEQAKSEFISLATHQLRTPVSGARWVFEMIRDGRLGPTTPEQQEFVKKAYESLGQMTSMINDLARLDVSEAQKIDYRFGPVQLEELVGRVIFEFSNRVREKQLVLNFLKPLKSLPPIAADSAKLGMALENILDNAVKYTPVGGKVTVQIKDDRINAARSVVEVVISDTGIGMPEEEQGRLFQRFYRGGRAVKFVPDGTGLGLFIAKSVIGHHGGEIWLSSREGRGTTVNMIIPLHQNKV